MPLLVGTARPRDRFTVEPFWQIFDGVDKRSGLLLAHTCPPPPPSVSFYTDITAEKRHCTDLKLHINPLPKKKPFISTFQAHFCLLPWELFTAWSPAYWASPSQRDFCILFVFPHITVASHCQGWRAMEVSRFLWFPL